MSTLRRDGQSGDNWCITWAADGHQYTSMCDGKGWNGPRAHSRVWRLEGEFDDFTAVNLVNYPAPPMDHYFGYGIISVDGTIYQFLSRVPGKGWSSPFQGINLIYSPDNGNTWFRHDGVNVSRQALDPSPASQFFWHEHPRTVHDQEAYAFSTVACCQMGQNNSEAMDNYVYLYSPDGPCPYQLNMARVPKDKLTDRSAYEYFKSRNLDGSAVWTPDMTERGVVHVFSDKTGNDYFGWYSWLPSVVWNGRLDLFIMVSGGTYAGGSLWLSDFYDAWMHTKTGSLGFYWAEKPWGPWTEFYYEPYWTVDDPANRTYQPKISPKWISEDGTEMVLIWSDAMKDSSGHSHTVNYKWNQIKIKIAGTYT